MDPDILVKWEAVEQVVSEPRDAKACLMLYTNNKDADQPGRQVFSWRGSSIPECFFSNDWEPIND